jgi:hypothetical protein
MIAGHDPLLPVSQPLFVPVQIREETLQGPWRYTRRQRNRLHTLASQIRQLALYIPVQMLARLTTPKTIAEFAHELPQLSTDTFDLLHVHVNSPYKTVFHKVASPRQGRVIDMESLPS